MTWQAISASPYPAAAGKSVDVAPATAAKTGGANVSNGSVAVSVGADEGGGSGGSPGADLLFGGITVAAPRRRRAGGGSEETPTILSKVSGCAVAGQVTAIIGPSGAGKSTLLRALAGKIPTHGGWKRLRSSTHSLTWQTPGTVAMVAQRDELLAAMTPLEAAVLQVCMCGAGASTHARNASETAAQTAADTLAALGLVGPVTYCSPRHRHVFWTHVS